LNIEFFNILKSCLSNYYTGFFGFAFGMTSVLDSVNYQFS